MKDRYITLHLEADSPEALSVLTIEAQERWGMTIDFFDFMQNKAGLYICWYKIPLQKWSEAVMNGRS